MSSKILFFQYLTSIYRPDEYENDYYVSHKISSENGEEPNNRLHYNLVIDLKLNISKK